MAVCVSCFAPLTRFILLPQNRTNAVNIARQHRQGHVALEAVDAVIGADVQAMHLQPIDCRLHRRMRTAGFDERLGVLFFLRLFA